MSAQERCPGGKPDCPYLEERIELREKIDELSELVVTDALTGLYNYRHLLWAINQEMERTHRSGIPFSLIVLDFDEFKRINDHYGHEFGNQVLKTAGTFFRRSLRQLDVACRYGGEEFVLVLPATDLREAIMLAERIREGVRHIDLQVDGKRVPLTISAGVDVYRSSERGSPEMLLDRADQFLLLAKQDGKNRVYSASTPESDDGMSTDERSALMDGFTPKKDR